MDERKRCGHNLLWLAKDRTTRDRVGLARGASPWSERKALRGVPPSQRVKNLLDIAFWKHRTQFPGVGEAELVRNTWVHISQELDRIPISKPLAPCLLSNSVLYSMEADATISGRAHLQLMGWPVSFIERSGISDSECRDLAGNSFSCPISCLISCCMIMNRFGPWWSEWEQ